MGGDFIFIFIFILYLYYIYIIYIYMAAPPPPPKDLCNLSVFSYFHSRAARLDHSSTRDRLLMTAQTPPSAHVSRIISSSPHRPSILKPKAAQYFNTVSRIEVLIHVEIQYGGSKIQDCTGLLGKNLGSWILDGPY